VRCCSRTSARKEGSWGSAKGSWGSARGVVGECEEGSWGSAKGSWGSAGGVVGECEGITASSRQMCDPHGCCTLNASLAVHGVRSDRVLIWELTVGALEAWVEVLKGWGCGVGGGAVDRRLVRCEVRGTGASEI
jgi:hypothetical protein